MTMAKQRKRAISCPTFSNEEFFLIVLVVVTYVSFSVVYILIPISEGKTQGYDSQEDDLDLLNFLNELIPDTAKKKYPENLYAEETLPDHNEPTAYKTFNNDTKYIYLVTRNQQEVEPLSKFIDEEWFHLSMHF